MKSDEPKKVRAIAVAQVLVELELPDTWSADTEIWQVLKQAKAGAKEKVNQSIKNMQFKILNDPQIQITLIEE